MAFRFVNISPSGRYESLFVSRLMFIGGTLFGILDFFAGRISELKMTNTPVDIKTAFELLLHLRKKGLIDFHEEEDVVFIHAEAFMNEERI